MLKISNGRNLIKLSSPKNKLFGKRFFLSRAFECEEAWRNRLKAPIFQKVQTGGLFAELEKQFSLKQRINVLDIDIFLNGITDDYYENEIQRILLKVRGAPETSILLESTSHAALRRLFTDKKSQILNILSQRMEYGLFPDTYFSIFMIDTFLKENDCLSAVKTAVLEMFQEDYNHPILRTLGLYSILKYLNSPIIWAGPKKDNDGDKDVDEEEVENVRVPFLRNEYFDDHFDITDTNHLVGKTMFKFGQTIEGPLGISNQLIGLILYEKFNEAKNLIINVIQSNNPVFKEALEKAEDYLLIKPKQPVEKNDENEETTDKSDSPPEIVDPPSEKIMLKELLNQLKNGNVLNGSLEDELKKLVEKEVKDHEENYITKQCEKYQLWEKKRLEAIELETKEDHKREMIHQIAKLKEEMEEEEKKLFYFELADEFNEELEKIEKQKQNIKHLREKRKKFDYENYTPLKY